MAKKGSVIARWVREAADEAIVVHALGKRRAVRYPVPVPVGWPVSDGNGGKRPAVEGEKRPLGEFVSERQIATWTASPRVQELRANLQKEHHERLKVKTRKLVVLTTDSLQSIIEGRQPQLDKYGQPKRGKSGRVIYESVPATVRIQAGNLAVKLAEYAEGPPAQKVEMEHSGKIELADLESARAARIAREAELAALLASRTADE